MKGNNCTAASFLLELFIDATAYLMIVPLVGLSVNWLLSPVLPK